jgi:hypothetical protein
MHHIAPTFSTAAKTARPDDRIDFINEQNTGSASTSSREQRSDNRLSFTNITTEYFRGATNKSIYEGKLSRNEVFKMSNLMC